MTRITDLMPENQFWQIIADTQPDSGSGDIKAVRKQQRRNLRRLLENLSDRELHLFFNRQSALHNQYDASHWLAAYLLFRGDCSDEAFDGLREWLVSCGETAFKQVQDNPDTLARFAGLPAEALSCKDFLAQAGEVFYKRTGRQLWETAFAGEDPEIDWRQARQIQLEAEFPQLAARYTPPAEPLQTDLNRSRFADEAELKTYLTALAKEYACRSNQLENRIEQRNSKDSYFNEFAYYYHPLLADFCTDKKRVYGGGAHSYGCPAKFHGVENAARQSAELKTSSRAEVAFQTSDDADQDFLFVLLKKGGVWRIDSYKRRFKGNSKWENALL